MHDVPILHHILLAFHTQLSGFAHGCFAAILDIILILDDLCPDKPFLEIRMDNAGALRCFPSLAIGPCLYFHLSGSDEGFEVQQAVDSFNQTVATALFQSQVFEEHLFFLVCLQFGNIGLGLGGDDDKFGILALDGFAHLLYVLVAPAH